MSESIKSDVMACKSKIPPVTKVVKAPATEEEKRQAVAMYKMGKGVCEIARETGRAQSTISRWVGTSVPKKQTPFGDIIRKAGREHAIVDGECTDEFDKEIDEAEMTIKKASAELKEEKSKSKTLMQAVEGIELKDYMSEYEQSLEETEKEPASAETLTSSDVSEDTNTITLNAENVKLANEMLVLASQTLDKIYKSDEFNTINTGLAVGFGRAWGILDSVINLMLEGK